MGSKASVEIVAPAITEREAEKLITVNKQTALLKSRLKTMYTGYAISIMSDYPNNLTVKHVGVNNSVTGASAYQVVYKSPWKGLLWALIPYLGIIVGPSVSIANSSANAGSLKESSKYSGQISLLEIKKGEPQTFNVLVPAGQTPQLSLKLWDKETDTVFHLNY